MSNIAAAAIGAFGQLGGSAISAAAQANLNSKNRAWQEDMMRAQWQAQNNFMDKQNEMNRENFDYETEVNRENAEIEWRRYSSPAAQRKAMEAAGINPFAPNGSALQPGATSVGSGNMDGAGLGTAGGPPSPGDRPNPLSNIGPAFASATNMIMDAKMKQAQIENLNAKTAREKAETTKVENENSIFPTIKAITESEGLSKKFRARLDEFNAKHAQDRLDIEQGNASASQFASIAAGIAKLEEAATSRVDREWIPKLNEAKIALQEAEARSADASASLAGEQAETERQLRPDQVQLLRNQAYSIAKDIALKCKELKIKGIEEARLRVELLNYLNEGNTNITVPGLLVRVGNSIGRAIESDNDRAEVQSALKNSIEKALADGKL